MKKKSSLIAGFWRNSNAMDIYQIEWKKSALKEIQKIDKSNIPKILEKIHALAVNPRPDGVRKLRGSEYFYRIRAGNYRIVYEISDAILRIYIIRIAHRKDVYNTF
ncbi:MAG: type II toxin-antitoxin system RelE/ParE family toxin [candidate division KSB1 bacterium]|nr:type II toxin-antitoxin system RelE/ParE family toxin [candidate division KSB1 bacterium]